MIPSVLSLGISKPVFVSVDFAWTNSPHYGLSQNSPLSRTLPHTLIVSVEFENVFDSVDKDTLWKLVRHYGPCYEGLTCREIRRGQPTVDFNVRTGVGQGCLLSPFLVFACN